VVRLVTTISSQDDFKPNIMLQMLKAAAAAIIIFSTVPTTLARVLVVKSVLLSPIQLYNLYPPRASTCFKPIQLQPVCHISQDFIVEVAHGDVTSKFCSRKAHDTDAAAEFEDRTAGNEGWEKGEGGERDAAVAAAEPQILCQQQR
jgi:hypothetical protein